MSDLSASLVGSPQNIETFLEEQSCYLLSAGFQNDHYVLDYFRKFRDEVLMHHPVGQWLVKAYYHTSPKYAHYIYKSHLLSAVVRFLGHIIYFIFKYWFIILSLPFVLLGGFRVIRSFKFS